MGDDGAMSLTHALSKQRGSGSVGLQIPSPFSAFEKLPLGGGANQSQPASFSRPSVRPRKSFVRFRRCFWRQRQTDRHVCMARGSIGHRTTRICVVECIPLPSSSLKSSPDPFREQTEQCNGRYSILESQCSSPSSHARICRSVPEIPPAPNA